ncbi:hypothetical protein RI367_003588 [Sorochytrium milnesiophthora]
MTTLKPKRLLWSPQQDAPLFLVASHDLRLYAWDDAQASATLVSSITEPFVEHWKCLSWSSDPRFPALIAVGLTNGRTMISAFGDSGATATHVAELAHAKSRPCTAVEFCPTDNRLIATGYEKVRNDSCLMVWDLETNSKLVGQGARPLSSGPVGTPTLQENGGAAAGTTYSSVHTAFPDRTMSMESATTGRSHTRHISIEQSQLQQQASLEQAMGGLTVQNYGTQQRPAALPQQSQQLWDRASQLFLDRTAITSPLGYFANSTGLSEITLPQTRAAGRGEERAPGAPLYQMGSSEAVSSLCWLPGSKHKLLAGTALKYIRLYDLREVSGSGSSMSALTFNTKAVMGITPDPYNACCFASYSEEGIVKLWDRRKATDALITLLPDSPRHNAINHISYVTSRANTLAISYRDVPVVKLYDLHEKVSAKPSHVERPHLGSYTSSSPGSPYVAASTPSPRLFSLQRENLSTSATSSKFETPPYNGRAAQGRHAADEQQQLHGNMPRHDLVVSHSREVTLPSSIWYLGWVPWSYMGRHRFVSVPKSTLETRVDVHEVFDPAIPVFSAVGSLTLARGPVLSVFPTSRVHERRQTGSTATGGNLQRSSAQASVPDSGILMHDISHVMAKRAVEGYGLNPLNNQNMAGADDRLKYLWRWYSDMELLASSGKAQIGGLDFSFQGILDVLQGIAAAAVNTYSSTVGRAAAARIIQAQQPVGGGHSAFTPLFLPQPQSPQRSLALAMCGWPSTIEELNAHIDRLQKQRHYERAAGCAFFQGDIERSIQLLRASDEAHLNSMSADERLKLIAAALAGYHSVQDEGDGVPSRRLYEDSCRALSTELEDPYLRAMFAYLGSRDWTKVLRESRVSLQDRVAVALRYLGDGELYDYVQRLTRLFIHTGSLDGVLLTGLTPTGVDLFSRYVDTTGDVQTPALVLSLVVPARFHDDRVEQWIESYRLYLDQLQLYHTRAQLDIGRAKLVSAEHNNVSPQIYVRCNFCNQSISQSVFIPGVKDKDGRRVAVTTSNMARHKVRAHFLIDVLCDINRRRLT